jgi:hypothetical protein
LNKEKVLWNAITIATAQRIRPERTQNTQAHHNKQADMLLPKRLIFSRALFFSQYREATKPFTAKKNFFHPASQTISCIEASFFGNALCKQKPCKPVSIYVAGFFTGKVGEK